MLLEFLSPVGLVLEEGVQRQVQIFAYFLLLFIQHVPVFAVLYLLVLLLALLHPQFHKFLLDLLGCQVLFSAALSDFPQPLPIVKVQLADPFEMAADLTNAGLDVGQFLGEIDDGGRNWVGAEVPPSLSLSNCPA